MEKREQSTLLAFVNKKQKLADGPNEEGERQAVELTNDTAVGLVVPSYSNEIIRSHG
jgi:hypothetical protein